MTHPNTPAELRAAAEAALKPSGARRIRLLAQLDVVDAELRPLVAGAVRAEVSQRRISALTGLSTTTIRRWLRESP